ncbi:hypothetical protein [Streptomyces sp. NPDC001978]|uniref:hypothetical protein n=1 Tax=Streptomyces sp. NPDC001978 TaxID=3364627 RepID=UPI0036AEAA4B
MDPTLLASGAIAVLVAFLKATADKSAELASEAALGRLKSLYQAVKVKLARSDVDAGVFERFEADPSSTARQRALEGVLAEAIQEDSEFAAKVAQLLKDSEPDVAHIIVTDSGAVAGGDVNQRGRYVAGRDLTVGVEPPQH